MEGSRIYTGWKPVPPGPRIVAGWLKRTASERGCLMNVPTVVRGRLHLWIAAALVLLAVILPASAEAGRNRAVIIGINGYYRLGKLECCVADARAVRDQLLRGRLFAARDVVLMTDDSDDANKPTWMNLTERFEGLAPFAGRTDTLLVFFAGHGVIGKDGRGYLIPIDCTKDRGLELGRVRAWLARVKAKNTFLILDSCHAGQKARGVGGVGPSLAAGAGIMVMASCAADEEAYDIPERGRGAFSLYLSEGLSGRADADNDGSVTSGELFTYVRDGVEAWAFKRNRTQTPVRLPEKAEKGDDNIPLARVPKRTTPGVPEPVIVPAPDLAPLPPPGKNLDECVKQLATAKSALADARKVYTPASRQVKACERNLASASESVRQGVLSELAPYLKGLRERRKALAVEMLPTHPRIRKLDQHIQSASERLGELAECLRPEDFRDHGIVAPLKYPADEATVKAMQMDAAGAAGVPVTKEVDLGGGVKMKFVYIPPGEFIMGSKDVSDDEKPVHRVRITKGFYLGIHEVAQAQYEAVVGKNPSHFKGRDNPVECVSWDDAVEFCGKLSRKTGETYRLPTEAEWEYACHAGAATKYGFGDSDTPLDEYAWYNKNSGGKAHAVGGRKPNAFGLYDMHGNVWEWCADWYDKAYYRKSPVENPVGSATDGNRVLRGGSWTHGPRGCRSAGRDGDGPADGDDGNGFRVVLSVQEF